VFLLLLRINDLYFIDNFVLLLLQHVVIKEQTVCILPWSNT